MRILLVEDDERVAGFIRRGLKAERYQIDVVSDGEAGLDHARQIGYELVILDVGLPTMDGFSVCRGLRDAGIQVPVLMLTARDSVEEKVKGFDSGADDYLTKPFAFEELLARIQALTRRRGALELQPVLKVSDLTLDLNTHEVERAGVAIGLTPREFALLECFMRRPNRVLSRTIIEELVWDYDTEPLTNVVDVYVRRLRRKVDEGHEPRLLHTVRGTGYMMRE